jgi:hypothetical protein
MTVACSASSGDDRALQAESWMLTGHEDIIDIKWVVFYQVGDTREDLEARLGVLAQWTLRDGHYVQAPLGEDMAYARGVRRSSGNLQMGLTRAEIGDVYRLLQRLVAKVDAGEITTF